MKLNKNLFAVGMILALLTFAISFILVTCNTSNDLILNYWLNVSLAIFGSSVVVMFTSIWGYFSERRKYELQYATFARDFMLRTVRFLNQFNNRVSKPNDVYSIAGNLHSLYDSFAYERDFDIYGYFLKNGKRRKRMERIHVKTYELSKELSRIEFLSQEAFHNNETTFTFRTDVDIPKLDEMHDAIAKIFKV